jgi:hypothetical protein
MVAGAVTLLPEAVLSLGCRLVNMLLDRLVQLGEVR